MGNRKFLLIVIDQLRADCIEGALESHVQLPNIRALQQEAVTFTNHFSVTCPCGPSRASLLTGLYAMNHRSVRNGAPLSDTISNVALEMDRHGYAPLLFGYTDVSRDPRGKDPNDPVLQNYEQVMPGFEELLEMRQDHGGKPWREYLEKKGYTLPGPKDFYAPVSQTRGTAADLRDPAFYRAEDSDTAFLTYEFLRQMPDQADRDWFALLTYIRPHPPFVAPEPYNRMYDPATLPLPARKENLQAEMAAHPYLAACTEKPTPNSTVRGFDGTLDRCRDSDVQTLRALYLGLASEVDMHLGRVFAYLKDSGQYDDTVIVLTSDHGDALGDHFMWGKQNPYDSSFHVPLIIRDPRLPAQFGQIVQSLTESIDIAPTILELAGADVPSEMDGTSLTSFLRGAALSNWKKHVHMELDFGDPAEKTIYQDFTGNAFHEANLSILRELRFKLVHFNGGLAPLLFDLENDPSEMNNLAADPAHASTLLRMTQSLLSHRMTHSDRTLSDTKIAPGGVIKYAP